MYSPLTPLTTYSYQYEKYSHVQEMHSKRWPLSHLGKLMDDHGDESSIDHSLDLLLVPSCDVGQEPDSFLQTVGHSQNKGHNEKTPQSEAGESTATSQ